MTIQELHLSFKFGLDKIDSLNYPNFTTNEIDLLLNQAQDRFVKQRYGRNNIKRESFEETQKRTEDLKTIVKAIQISPSTYSADNIETTARFYTLPTDHSYVIQETVDVIYQDCHNQNVAVKTLVRPLQHNDYDKLKTDPFNKPNKQKILRLMFDGKVELIAPAGVTLGTYHLRYLKIPQRVDFNQNITLELPEDTHQEVVDGAVKIALENIQASRNATFNEIINTQE